MRSVYLSRSHLELNPVVERGLFYWIFVKGIVDEEESIKIKVEGEELTVTDPFEIPLPIADRLDFKAYKVLYNLLETKYADLIEEGFKKTGAIDIVLCDHKVVASSNDPEGLIEDRIRKIEEKKGKICYILGKTDRVEEVSIGESEWNIIFDDDWYPTIPIYLGKKEWNNCKEVIEKGIKISADFDTGNPTIIKGGYLAFPDKFRRALNEPPGIRGKKYRFERGYYYFLNNIQIGIKDVNGNDKCSDFDVHFVEDSEWENTFQEGFSPKRDAFVGRELLFKLLFSVTLNPKTRISTLKLL